MGFKLYIYITSSIGFFSGENKLFINIYKIYYIKDLL